RPPCADRKHRRTPPSRCRSSRRPSLARLSPSRWSPPTPSTMLRRRFKTRRASRRTSSV
uniref:Uncharacterized protein n=1 Tax=Triticum urartu TaxID=4572 RepID=A0A8R7R9C2_TRIUA